MAIRNIRYDGDDILRKVCRPVEKMDDRTLTLIDDMFDTMYEANGVGLAAPQVGIDFSSVNSKIYLKISSAARHALPEVYPFSIRTAIAYSGSEAGAYPTNIPWFG